MRTKQKDDQFIKLLDDFRKAHLALANFFTDQENDDEYGLIAPSLYPFNYSFDEYVKGIDVWVKACKKGLEPKTMKTNLDRSIGTNGEAISFLTELCKNREDYHPDDDTFDIKWNGLSEEPSYAEKLQLNNLMNQIRQNTTIDPCEIVLNYYK